MHSPPSWINKVIQYINPFAYSSIFDLKHIQYAGPRPLKKKEEEFITTRVSFLCSGFHMEIYDQEKIEKELEGIPEWSLKGDEISRTFNFDDFVDAIKFVNRLADIAEEAVHHPDIDIRYDKVTLALVTHDAGGLTSKDFSLAKQIDAL